MKCPKCGEEMIAGEIDDACKRGCGLFWAEKDFFNKHVSIFTGVKKAVEEGGVNIPVKNGFLSVRTKGWACKNASWC